MEKFIEFVKKMLRWLGLIMKFMFGLLKSIYKFFKALFTGNLGTYFSNLFYHKRKMIQQRLKDMREHDPNKKSAPTVQSKFMDRAPKRAAPEKGQVGIDKFKNQRTNDIKSKAEQKGTAGKDLHLKKKKTDEGSFADRSKHNLSKYIYLVTGQDKGRDAWHYVLVDPPKLQVFRAKTQGGSLDVADYGKVLYSGWGKTPPEEIKDKIKDAYLSPEARKREDEYELKKKEEEALEKKEGKIVDQISNENEISDEEYISDSEDMDNEQYLAEEDDFDFELDENSTSNEEKTEEKKRPGKDKDSKSSDEEEN